MLRRLSLLWLQGSAGKGILALRMCRAEHVMGNSWETSGEAGSKDEVGSDPSAFSGPPGRQHCSSRQGWEAETRNRVSLLGYHLGAQCPPSALEIWGRTVMGRQRWAVQGPADRCCSAFPICGLSVCIYTWGPTPVSRQTLKHCDPGGTCYRVDCGGVCGGCST